MISIELNSRSEKWEAHSARKEGHYLVVGALLAEFDNPGAAQRYARENCSLRAALLKRAKEHVNQQIRAGFSVVPNLDDIAVIFCPDGSVQGKFDSLVNLHEVVSTVCLTPKEVQECSD